jgi:molecular chaperone GrpE
MTEEDRTEDFNKIEEDQQDLDEYKEEEEEEEKGEEIKEEESQSMENMITELKQERDELMDKYLRALANYENLRKRAIQEKEKTYNFTLEEVFRKVLPILDDFGRAFKSLNGSTHHKDDYKAFIEGIRLILSNFEKLLNSYNIEPFDSVGEKFDPSKHEAIHVMENNDEEEGKILEETEIGYKIKDKILRPAKVIVAKKPEEIKNINNEEGNNQGGNSE